MVSKIDDRLEILSRNLCLAGTKIWPAQSIFDSVLGLGFPLGLYFIFQKILNSDSTIK